MKLAAYPLLTFPVVETVYLFKWEDKKEKGERGSGQQLECTCVYAAIVFFASSSVQLWKQSAMFPTLSLNVIHLEKRGKNV